jgi:type IV pilus assembly protein PilV
MMLEVLVAIVLCAFALLGFAAMQSRATTAEFEALQRSQALVLVDDMVTRISANRADADAYVSSGVYGAGSLQDCTGLAGTALDTCQWANLLRGASETRAGASVGAMLGARGCITRAAGTTHRFIVSVAWTGVVATGAPSGPCGQGDPAFPDDTLRRVASATMCVAQLADPAIPPVVSRC